MTKLRFDGFGIGGSGIETTLFRIGRLALEGDNRSL